MSVCIYTYIYVGSLHVPILDICIHISRMYMYIYINIYIYVCLGIDVYIYLCVYVQVYAHVKVYIYRAYIGLGIYRARGL